MVNGSICCTCSVVKKQLIEAESRIHNHSTNITAIEKTLSSSKEKVRKLKDENLQLKNSNYELRKQNDELKELILQNSSNITTPPRQCKEMNVINNKGHCEICRQNMISDVLHNGITSFELHQKLKCHRSISDPSDTACGNYTTKQIESLTMEKKQLMTNVHWLNNEIVEKDKDLRRQRLALLKCNCSDVNISYTSIQSLSSIESNLGSLEEGRAPPRKNEHPKINQKLSDVTNQLLTLRKLLIQGKNESQSLETLLISQKENLQCDKSSTIYYSHAVADDSKDFNSYSNKRLDLPPSSFLAFQSHCHNLNIV